MYVVLVPTESSRSLIVPNGRGTFTNVRYYNNEAFAAQCKPNEIQVFSLSDMGQWMKMRVVRVPIKKTGFTLTLSVGARMRCTSWRENKIHEYTPLDETWTSHGRVGTDTAGQFNEPFISADDVSGNILIADRCNHRLQVMDASGSCKVVSMRSSVFMPISATLFNNHLYVINNKFIYKYVPTV